jgi:anti-sigma factor RsiW
MECRIIRTRFIDCTDGDLLPTQRKAMDKHIAQCPACAEYRSDLESFLATADEHCVMPGPAYDFDQLRDRLHETDAIQEIVRFAPRMRVARGFPRLAMAALILIMTGAATLAQRGGRALTTTAKRPFTEHRTRLAQAYTDYIDNEAPRDALEKAKESTNA